MPEALQHFLQALQYKARTSHHPFRPLALALGCAAS